MTSAAPERMTSSRGVGRQYEAHPGCWPAAGSHRRRDLNSHVLPSAFPKRTAARRAPAHSSPRNSGAGRATFIVNPRAVPMARANCRRLRTLPRAGGLFPISLRRELAGDTAQHVSELLKSSIGLPVRHGHNHEAGDVRKVGEVVPAFGGFIRERGN